MIHPTELNEKSKLNKARVKFRFLKNSVGKMKVKIIEHNMRNSVNIILPKDVRNKISASRVFIKEVKDELWIREALQMDENTLSIIQDYHITYTSKNAKKFIGEFEYEIEKDFIILYRA